jgi:hypothetical protein
VTITAAGFASLKQNMGTQTNSTFTTSAIYGSHAHTVLVSCA